MIDAPSRGGAYKFTMGGALFSHATKIGWSGNAAAEMWPMALLVLAAAIFVIIGRRARA